MGRGGRYKSSREGPTHKDENKTVQKLAGGGGWWFLGGGAVEKAPRGGGTRRGRFVATPLAGVGGAKERFGGVLGEPGAGAFGDWQRGREDVVGAGAAEEFGQSGEVGYARVRFQSRLVLCGDDEDFLAHDVVQHQRNELPQRLEAPGRVDQRDGGGDFGEVGFRESGQAADHGNMAHRDGQCQVLEIQDNACPNEPLLAVRDLARRLEAVLEVRDLKHGQRVFYLLPRDAAEV
mmetsp:Transcript_22205/g.68367  ORF Transcript_22205/g.68367 Transcript_22205/m.68367 type:complete len:234 (+) Transcript_22205:106-807(+)